jgi:predicted ATPase/DNA-binding winged helix-turn-helix (wHTH) protein
MQSRCDLQGDELVYSFGPFRLFPKRQLLLRNGSPVKVAGAAFELLHLLVRRHGELLSKDELLACGWPHTVVHESNLKVNMLILRRSLGDVQARPSYIATVHRRGYKFVAAVTVALAEAPIREGDGTSTAACGFPQRRNIIGREEDLARLIAGLEVGGQVTLVGAGGVGKTTLAINAGHALRAECPDGACLIDLSTLDDPMLLPATVASALGLRGEPADTLMAIVEYLSARRMFVVLDSCEHVLPMAALLARNLSIAGAQSRVLATSREPLGIQTERVLRLEPLACPNADDMAHAERAIDFPAVQLFARRAVELAGYSMVDADYAPVASICRALDGLPLAIELAASKLEILTPRQLSQMLDEQLCELSQQGDGVPPRHQTLLATIDWSYRLLSPQESTIFRRVSMFADAFELEDVVAIATPAGLNATTVTTCLGGLVAKSLLVAEASSGAGLRYRLLDSTRCYASQRLHEDPLEAEAQYAYAQRILALFEQAEGEWDWRETSHWTARYRARLSELRKALAWAFGHAEQAVLGIRLSVAAIPLWFEMSALAEGRSYTEQALQRAQTVACDETLRMKLACFRAWSMIYAQKRLPESEQIWLEAIDFAERAGNVSYQLRGLLGLAIFLMLTGEVGRGIERLDQVSAMARHHQEWSFLPEADRLRALANIYTGRLFEGAEVLERLAIEYPRVDRRSRMAGFQVDRFIGIRCYLPLAEWLSGRPDSAAKTAREAVLAAGRLGHLLSQSNALALAAIPVALWNGDIAALACYSMQLKANLEVESTALWIPVQRFFAAALRDLRGEIDAVDEMRASIEQLIECRFTVRIGMYLGILADALARQGRLDEAYDAMVEALDYQSRQQERWCRPELQRIQASILHRAGYFSCAERLLHTALADAREMRAAGFELRIVNDLAVHAIDNRRCSEAMQLLGAIYQRFSEGRHTKDVMTAAQLLRRAREIAA